MKTRHILTAMVLPAFMAACTADDFVENNSINLGGRAELAPISFTVDGGADTRFIFDEAGNGNWKWESAKDAFSAFLVESSGTPEDKLYTNYIYKSADGSKYETTSKMVEGIYWFYAPADENKNTRDLLPFKLQTSQDADYYKSDDAKVFFTGLYKLTKDDNAQNINLSLMNYYSRAVFPLTNNTDAAVKVKQIILKGGEEFQVEGAISTAKLTDYMYGFTKDGEMVSMKNLDKDADNDETIAELKTRLQKADLAIAPTDGTIKTSPALVLNLGEGVSIAKGTTESFTMLVPRTGEGVSCEITIITDKGMVEIKSNDKSNYAKNVQFKHNGIMPMFGLQNSGAFKSYSLEKDKFTDIGDAYYVSSYDDMMALINTVNGDIEAYNFGDWSVDAAMAAAIAKSDAYVKFQQPIEIADAKNEIALTKVEFAGGATVAKGTKVDFKAAIAGVGTNRVQKNLTIAEGATATLSAVEFGPVLARVAAEKTTITNKGTLTIAGGAELNENVEITSTGALTLEDNTDAVIKLNGGSLNYATAKTEGYPEYATEDKLILPNAAALSNNITITVAKNVTLNVDADLTAAINKVENVTYKTDIVNNGIIEVAESQTLTANGGLTNNGTIETLTGATGFVIGGTATNAANAIIKGVATTINSGATLTNNGEILGTTVTNNGKIVTAGSSRTTVTAGEGVVDNTAMCYVAVNGGTQAVTYEVTEALNSEAYGKLAANFGMYKINKLIFKNKLTVDATTNIADEITAVEFAAGSSIDVKGTNTLLDFKGVTAATISANTVFGGFDAASSNINFTKAVSVTVKKNCTLTINYVTVKNTTASNTTFVSEDKEESDPATTKRGKVVNNGVVKGAAEAYADDNGWWSGEAAATAI